MIYVTVGTNDQQFNRLVRCVDELKGKGIIIEDVIIQTGYSDYIPENCEWKKLYSHDEMLRNVENARIVITHGGPSSIILPLRMGKIPIVVPRQKKYGEQVNDHQVFFSKTVSERYNNIILVNEIEELKDVLSRYNELAVAKRSEMGENNNERFVNAFSKIVDEL